MQNGLKQKVSRYYIGLLDISKIVTEGNMMYRKVSSNFEKGRQMWTSLSPLMGKACW
jgi:hypothetical protein